MKVDTAAAAASKVILKWHFVAAGAESFAFGQAKGETAEKAVEKLRSLLCVKKSKIKAFKYHLFLVHPDTHLQGINAWAPDGCVAIPLGEFTGEVKSD